MKTVLSSTPGHYRMIGVVLQHRGEYHPMNLHQGSPISVIQKIVIVDGLYSGRIDS